ncbi:ATP-dependent Clp protease proteolytic subunit [Rahnella selenatireducens]|uniref:ATP-dependent Clp protease proteolytic subunit n=1 Tax=Rahnella selenatireducens TaxID=3389797 RepID=UPI0039683CCA
MNTHLTKKLKKMKKILIAFVAVIASAGVKANVVSIRGDTVTNGEVNEIGVYFNGSVNNQTVTWLISSLADIQSNYRNVKNIDLYLNSDGGDMDAGYVAYEALRKTPQKLNIINASMTGSAATMIYCASNDRYTMPMARFMMHPAASGYEKVDYMKPDQARRILEEDDSYNALFRKVYTSCTNLTPDELEKITASESGRVIYSAEQAQKNGLVNKGIRDSQSYPLTYFITDSQS